MTCPRSLCKPEKQFFKGEKDLKLCEIQFPFQPKMGQVHDSLRNTALSELSVSQKMSHARGNEGSRICVRSMFLVVTHCPRLQDFYTSHQTPSWVKKGPLEGPGYGSGWIWQGVSLLSATTCPGRPIPLFIRSLCPEWLQVPIGL